MPATKRKPPPPDPLDIFAAAGLEEALKLVLWNRRFDNPTLTVEVHPDDLKGFQECIQYLNIRPQVRVMRPPGIPGRAEVPAQHGRPAVAGRSAIPPKNYVVVQLVDQDGHGFVPIENDQEKRERQIAAEKAASLKTRAQAVSAALATDLGAQTFSTATIQEAVQVLREVGSR